MEAGVKGPNLSSTQKTVAAVRGFRRRTFLALGTAAVGVAAGVQLMGGRPKRELSILHWPSQLPNSVVASFEQATGIKVNATPLSHNEEQITRLLETRGEGFDLCQATRDRAPQFRD